LLISISFTELKHSHTAPRRSPSYPPHPRSESPIRPKSATTTTSSTSSLFRTSSDPALVEEEDPMLLDLITILIERVETLWDVLKIPKKEQSFYRQTLCTLPVESITQCYELSRYIELLEEYRHATEQVVINIRTRETAIHQCFDVVMAIHRKLTLPVPNSLGIAASSSATTNNTSAFSNSSTAATAAGAGSTSTFLGDMFWKEEFLSSLFEVRMTSLEVIKSIQTWRKLLWRPYGFLWKDNHTNYMLKMKHDMNFLMSDIGKQLCDVMTLSLHDLYCIVYNHSPLSSSSVVNSKNNNETGNENGNNGNAKLGNASSMLKVSFSSSSFHNSTNNNNNQHEEVEDSSSYHQLHQQYFQQLLQNYRKAFEHQELQDASLVIFEEEMIQQAILKEKEALNEKGVFIPLLRNKPDSSEKKASSKQKEVPVVDNLNNTVNSNPASNTVHTQVPFSTTKKERPLSAQQITPTTKTKSKQLKIFDTEEEPASEGQEDYEEEQEEPYSPYSSQ